MQAHGSSAQQQEAVIRVLREAAPEQAVLASVRNACLLIEPCCGMDTYQAAVAGEFKTCREEIARQTGRRARGLGIPWRQIGQIMV